MELSEGAAGTCTSLDVADGAARLTLRVERNRNALTEALVDEILDHLKRLASNPQVHAVVLAHTGTTFCAGLDLKEAEASSMEAATSRMVRLFSALVEFPVPVIAEVDGHVRAGGLGLLGACDLVVSGPRSTFAFSEARLAVAPVVVWLTLQHCLDPRSSSRYTLTGETFDSREADVRHEGSRPIAITWRLRHRLSGDLFESFAAVVA